MQLRNYRATSIAAAIALALAASAAHAELATWDQTQVTRIATELTKATHDAYEHVYKQPQMPGDRKLDDMQRSLRNLRSQTRALSGNLEKGKGREQTDNIYKSIMMIWRNIGDDARRSFEANPVSKSLARVQDLLDQISPYYDADANEND